ncbi:MAG: sulfite exporter TauE/SafE family protein [Deltaproteobacteria bacterium]|nr:sulfite exporter TauE/SafE family protein [Deltaproteobacteria bacterium]MCB9480146.1 sulfite exporter TauE/SafE family protein [Deltaproteobacteria bacterium]MCB9487888.1 sulfite exporter TauE/SafE family protein [Deltaproteobacteria bacterium]
MTTWIIYAGFLVTGVFSGFLGGFAGVGGGVINVPALDALFHALGLPPDSSFTYARGTSLAIILMTSISASRTHHDDNGVNWPATVWSIVGGAVGTTIASQIALNTDPTIMKAAFGIVLWGVAARIFWSKSPEHVDGAEVTSPWFFLAMGASAGIIVGLFGLGGGILNLPILLLLGRFQPHRAVGTSAAVVAGYAAIGAANYAWATPPAEAQIPHAVGYVHLPAWIFVAAASMILAHYGARAAQKLDPKPLKMAISGLMVIVGLRYVAGLFF